MTRTFKALSALLCYPTAELQAAMPELAAAIEGEALLPAGLRRQLEPLMNEIATGDLYDLQERYVLLFDRTRSLSLHLFEHVHGESRDRGQAMIDLKSLYESGGLEIDAAELPDFVPLFLEFLSTRPRAEAYELLGQPAHIFAALAERLRKRQSAYEAVFRALTALAASKPKADDVSALLAEPGSRRERPRGARCRLGRRAGQLRANAGNGCKDGLIARIRAGLRPRRRCSCERRRTRRSGEEMTMSETLNYLVFGWYPYLCLTVFLLGSLVRFDREQYTWRSGSSQLLRRRQLFWGSNLFHVGILVIFVGHFVGLLTPIWIFDALGISHTFKQWMAIVIGGVAGTMCFIGITLAGAPSPVRLAHPQNFVVRRYRYPADALRAIDPWPVDDFGIAPSSRRPRDGEVHDLGAGYPDAAARRLGAGRRCQSDLQAASAPRHDDLPRLPVHSPRARLERAGLVSRPPRLSGGADNPAMRPASEPRHPSSVHRAPIPAE